MSAEQNKQSKAAGQLVLKIGKQNIPLLRAFDVDPALLEALTTKETAPPAAGFPMEFFQVISPGINSVGKWDVKTATFRVSEPVDLFLRDLLRNYEMYRIRVDNLSDLIHLVDREYQQLEGKMELIKQRKQC